MHLVEVREHGLAGSLESSPLTGIRKRGNGDRLAAVEAGERRIDQFINFHDSRKLIDILAGVSPDLGPRCRRQHGLNVYALGPEFSVKTLAQKEDERLGRTVDGGTVLRRQPYNR